MQKISFIGGPCTGKTTLALETVAHLRKKGVNAVYVYEYAREFILRHKTTPTAEQQIEICKHQIELEDLYAQGAKILIAEIPVFIGLIYSLHHRGIPCHQTEAVSDIFNRLNLSLSLRDFIRQYDHLFLLHGNLNFQKDPGRAHGQKESKIIHQNIVGFLDHHQIPYHELSGQGDERLQAITQKIGVSC